MDTFALSSISKFFKDTNFFFHGMLDNIFYRESFIILNQSFVCRVQYLLTDWYEHFEAKVIFSTYLGGKKPAISLIQCYLNCNEMDELSGLFDQCFFVVAKTMV